MYQIVVLYYTTFHLHRSEKKHDRNLIIIDDIKLYTRGIVNCGAVIIKRSRGQTKWIQPGGTESKLCASLNTFAVFSCLTNKNHSSHDLDTLLFIYFSLVCCKNCCTKICCILSLYKQYTHLISLSLTIIDPLPLGVNVISFSAEYFLLNFT